MHPNVPPFGCECDSTPEPGYVFYRNGSQHVRMRCPLCKLIYLGSVSKVPYLNTPLPTWEDNSNPDLYPECSYNGCNAPGYEDHHWAMRSLFADADKWPMSPLCQPHHSLWHATMLRAGLRYPKKVTA